MTNPYRAHISVTIDFTDTDCEYEDLDPDQYADLLTRWLIAAISTRTPNPFTCNLDDVTESPTETNP
jgi:hypothetical protein